jgi:hypothetical protein
MPHVSLLCLYAYQLYLTCDMDKSSLRHIHDPVLLSLKVEVICCYTRIFAFSCQFSFLRCWSLQLHSQRMFQSIFFYVFSSRFLVDMSCWRSWSLLLLCNLCFNRYCLSYSAFFCFLMASLLVSAILVARYVITLYYIHTRTYRDAARALPTYVLRRGPSTGN